MVTGLRRSEPVALVSIGGSGNIRTGEATQRVSWTGLGTLKLSTGGAGVVSGFFSIRWTKLRMLYESVVSWGINLREAEATRLNKTIHKSSDVVGAEPHSLTAGREQLGQRLSLTPGCPGPTQGARDSLHLNAARDASVASLPVAVSLRTSSFRGGHSESVDWTLSAAHCWTTVCLLTH